MKSRTLSKAINFITAGRLKYGWWSCSFQSHDAPVVIGGCGRSGTTLLRAMLNAHCNLAIGPETGLFCGNSDFDDLAFATQIDRRELNRIYHGSACLGEFVERIMNEQRQRSGKSRWGEKSPSNVQAIGRIFRFFPQARFMHLIRDGRDVVCSLRDHPKYRWQNGVRIPTNICNPWPKCVERWVRDTRAGLKWRSDHRYCEVRYEDLVADSEQVLRRILAWLGEPWDPSVMSYHQTHEERASDAANPGVKKPVYRQACGRWKTDLPADAVSAFTPEARQLLVELNYANDSSWTHQGIEDRPAEEVSSI